MSQVKKLQSGGSLTIDGKRYEATPELIMNLSGYLSSFGETAAPLAGLTAALQRGENVTYDSIGNTITGMEGNWAGVDEKAEKKYASGRSQWRRNWDATFNNDAHKFRKAVSLLSGFSGFGLNGNTPQTDSNLLDIFGNQTFYNYRTNEDGSKTYVKDAAENTLIPQRLTRMTDYLKLGDTEGNKIYKLGSWYTQDPSRLAALRALYEGMSPDEWNQRIADIGSRAEANALTDDDRAFLKNFNIFEDAVEDANGGFSPDRKKWTDAGWGDLYPTLGGIASIGDDGTLQLNPGESWGWNLGDLAGRNIWFNDDFYNSKYGASGDFDPVRGLTLYDNKLYRPDSPILARILNAEGGWNQLMRSGNWNAADEIIATRFTPARRENPEYLTSDKYSEFLSNNPDYRFSDLTGLYDIAGGLGNNQIVSYVDLKDDSYNGPYREYGYKFALLDSRGKKIRDLTREELIPIENGVTRENGLETYKRVVGTGNQVYDGKYYEDILDKNKKATGFRIYRDPKNPNGNVILHMPKIDAAGLNEDTDLILPPKIAELLMKNEDLWDKIVGNAQNQKNFIRIMSKLVQSKNRQREGEFNAASVLFGPIINKEFWSSDKKDLQKMGFSDSDLQALVNALHEAYKGSREDRRLNYTVQSPLLTQEVLMEKYGGILQKLQKGGIAGGTKNSIGVTEKRTNVNGTNYKNAASLGEIGSKNWTEDDTKDLIALGMDLGSLGFAFTPATAVAAGTGAAASTLRYSANRGRGTKGAGGQYALDLAMDAASLLPGMKVLKSASAVRKALPTLLKLASVAGLGTAFVNTATKIANGEKFTAKDASILVNGITAGVNLAKVGGFGKQSTTTKQLKPVELKSKVEGEASLKLSSEELKDIDTPEKLFDVLFNKAKAKNSNLTQEQFSEKYDVSKLLENVNTWKPGWNPKTWFKKTSIKKFKPSVEKVLSEKKPTGNKLKDWWYGVGDTQQGYRAMLAGETPMKTSAYELTRTDTNVYPTKPRVFRTKGTVQSREIPMSEYKGRNFTSEVVPGGFEEFNGPGMRQLPGVANYRAFITRQTPMKLNGIALPQWIYPFTKANYQENEFVQPAGFVMKPLYKKGGILKGQSGLKQIKIEDPKLDFSELNKVELEDSPINQSYLDRLTYENLFNAEKQLNNEKRPYQSDFVGKAFNFDLNPLMNIGRAVHSMQQSNKQLNNWLRRPRYQMQEPLLNAPRYINSGTGDAYRTAANTQRMYKPVTSDATSNWGQQQQQLQTAIQTELQGDLADSQEFGKYLSGLSEFLNNNALRRTDIVNQNGQLDWQHDVEDVQMKNANIAEKSKFFDQAAYSVQDWYSRMNDARNRIRGVLETSGQMTITDNEFRNKMNAWNQKYPTPELQATPQAQMELTWINNWAKNQKDLISANQASYQIAFPFHLAKGGTVGKASKVTYSRDPYPELLLQNAKDSTKMVEKLSDSVIKLLLQTKPLHVS